MKKLTLLFVMILGLIILKAQVAPTPAAAKKAPAALNMGHIYGKVLDADGKPIAEASVVLLQSKFDTATKKNKEVLLKCSNCPVLLLNKSHRITDHFLPIEL